MMRISALTKPVGELRRYSSDLASKNLAALVTPKCSSIADTSVNECGVDFPTCFSKFVQMTRYISILDSDAQKMRRARHTYISHSETSSD
jgi:hypothetical protein